MTPADCNVGAGERGAVPDVRGRWQQVMRSRCSGAIEKLTGRTVIGFMSDDHVDPEMAVEVFLLEALPARAGR